MNSPPLQGLKTVNTADGSTDQLEVAGLFYGIGHQPNSKLIAGQVALDDAGYVQVGQGRQGRGGRHRCEECGPSRSIGEGEVLRQGW